MSDLTWSDIAYQERHGYLPDRGSSSEEMREFYGDPNNGDYDESEVAATERLLAESAQVRRIAALECELEDMRELVREQNNTIAKLRGEEP